MRRVRARGLHLGGPITIWATCPQELTLTMRLLLVCFRSLILFVADLFHPINRFAIELFLNGDVRHGRGGCSAVPMLFARGKPDDVARTNFLYRTSPTLRAPAASGDNQRLTQRVRVPCGS